MMLADNHSIAKPGISPSLIANFPGGSPIDNTLLIIVDFSLILIEAAGRLPEPITTPVYHKLLVTS